MSDYNVFGDEWRRCLREHYKYTVENDPNPRNLESVTRVLAQPNGDSAPIFPESELDALAAMVRGESDAMDAPAPQPLTPAPVPPTEFIPHPLECQCPSCVEVNLTPHDDEGQPMVLEEEEIAELAAKSNQPPPQQLSMF